MVRLLALYTLLGLLPGANGQSSEEASTGVPVEGITYTYSASPNLSENLSDPDFSKLIDGTRSAVGWRRIPALDIDFDLKARRHLSEVVFETYRPNKGWFAKQVSLYLDSGQGFELVDVIQTGHKPGLEVSKAREEFRFKNIDRDAVRARLRVEQSGNCAFQSVRFYEQKQSGAEASPETQPTVSERIVYNLPPQPDALTVSEVNLDGDPELEVLMANRYLTLVIEPAAGGVISALKVPGHPDYTVPKSKTAPSGGLLSDHVSSQNLRGDWWDVPYEIEISKSDPKKVSVRLWKRGTSGVLSFLTFSKTITLYADRSDIEVQYQVGNAEEALVPLPHSLWFHSFAGIEGWQRPGTFAYFVPMRDGIRRIDPGTDVGGESSVWMNGPTRGWAGMLDVKERVGLAFSVDYRYLSSFYFWWVPTSRVPTLEWRFFEVPIPNGGSFDTAVTIQPFAGLDKLSGVSRKAVGELVVQDGKLQAQIVPGSSAPATLAFRYRRLPDKEWKELAAQSVALEAGKRVEAGIPLPIKEDGTYAVSAVLNDSEGKPLLVLEEPYVRGGSSGNYTLDPDQEQFRVEAQDLDLAYTSTEVETPHVPWARPYSRGKTKAVLFTASYLDRDIIELAQRMDLDFDTTYIYSHGLRYALGDYVAKASQSDLLGGLEKLWKRSPDWQVLVLPGAALNYLPEADRQMILDKVANEGRGLVIVEPADIAPFEESLPTGKRGGLVKNVKWSADGDHYITRGIPFSLMPPTDVYDYPVREGEVIASAGEKPLVVVGSHGKGRVAVLTYRAGTDKEVEGRAASLMPMMYGEKRDLAPVADLKEAHEYQFLLLVRSILWAAHQEPDATVQSVSVTRQGAALQIKNDGAALEGSLAWTVRDRYGAIVGSGSQPMKLAAGEQTLKIAAPLPVLKGSLSAWLRNAGDAVIDCGVYPLDIPAENSIASVEPDRDVLKSTGELGLRIKLASAPQPGTELRLSLVDGFERELFRESMQPTGLEVSKQIKLEGLMNRLLEVKVTLWQGGVELDSHLDLLPVKFPLRKSVRDGEPHLVPWTALANYTRGFPSYLFGPIMKQLKGLGANSWILGFGDGVSTVLDSGLRHNMAMVVKQNGIGSTPKIEKGTEDKPVRKMKIYENIPKAVKQVDDAISRLGDYGAFESMMGDENQLADLNVDVSFEPSYLAAFREWLKGRYPGLPDLNRQWDTAFSGWDEVTPSTLNELRRSGSRNFSSWCDFRAFGDYSVAYFFEEMRRRADAIDPGYYVSMSGTAFPNPYHGYDYWLLSKSLNAIAAYSGVDEMVSFASRETDIRKWAGSSAGGDLAVKNSIYHQFFSGGTGLNVYNERLLFKPDLRFSTYGEGFLNHYKPFREGVGRLLLNATIQKDQIAIHYSQNSMRVAYALGEYELWKQSRESAVKFFENIGFDPGWISSAQLEAGEAAKYKVIVLPASASISEAEATAIERFVKEGGIVISTLSTGVADGYGRMVQTGPLDSLFGFQRSGGRCQDGKWIFASDAMRGFPVGVLETGIKPTDAKVMAATATGEPALLCAKRGKGEAWYVACDLMSAYETMNRARTIPANAGFTAAMDSYWLKALADRHVAPKVQVREESGSLSPFVKLSRFVNGEIEYFALLRDYRAAAGVFTKSTKALVTFPKKGYVHEVLQHEGYGFTDRAATVLTADTAQLFAVLPYKVDKVEAATKTPSVLPGAPIDWRISVLSDGKPGDHVFHVKVFGPSGKMVDHYTCNVVSRDGVAEWRLLTALNDEPGAWRLEVTDVITGLGSTSPFTLGAPQDGPKK